MSCPNFSRVNARNFYVLYSTYKTEDEEGNEIEVERDSWDWEDFFDWIRERVSDKGYKHDSSTRHNLEYDRKMEAGVIAYSNSWNEFGKKHPWPLQTEITKTIYVKDGYYSGANLDWDVEICSSTGDNFRLSEYENLNDMLDDIMRCYEDQISWHGDQVGWNLGTFRFQAKNIRNWIENLINQASDELDEICKEMCEQEYYCAGIFSNGEAIYYKVKS